MSDTPYGFEPGFEYTRECEAERRDLEARWRAEAEQEAFSVRYAHRLGLVFLYTICQWAIFGANGLIDIVETLDGVRLAALFAAEVRGYETRRQVEANRRSAQAAPSVNPEDLGL